MNKKFSTLVASLLLAGAVVVPADSFAAVQYKDGKTYSTVKAETALPAETDEEVEYLLIVKKDGKDHLVTVSATPANGFELTELTAEAAAIANVVKIKKVSGGYEVWDGTNKLGFATGSEAFGGDETTFTAVDLKNGKVTITDGTGYVKFDKGAFSVVKEEVSFDAKAVKADAMENIFILPEAGAVAAGQLDDYKANSRLAVYDGATGELKETSTGDGSYFLSGKGSTIETTEYPDDGTDADAFYWTFKNGRLISEAGKTFAADDVEEFVMVPVKGTPYFQLKVAKGDDKDKFVKADLSLSNVDEKEAGALFASVEPGYTTDADAETMNKVLGNGFALTIAKANGSTETVEQTGAFSGVLKAEGEDEYYQLKNGNKYVALNTAAEGLTTDVNAEGLFELIAADKLADPDYMTYFKVVKADNGENSVKVLVSDDESGTITYRLYISKLLNKYVLSAAEEDEDITTWAYVTLGDENSVDLKTLLKGQFIKVNYVKTGEETTANKYKVDGILSVRDDAANGTNAADYVAKSSVIAEAPEAQWALTYDEDEDQLTLTNRENTKASLVVTGLRATNQANVYKVASENNVINGDLITITFVENHTPTDGYMVVAENVLRNQTFYLGQSRQTADGDMNAYWAENHGTHQIGATVDENLATKWNLNLVKKASSLNEGKNASEIDSVLVVSTMNVWKDDELTEKKDTLVILPYAFQNRENSEFVKMNDDVKLKYYICDEGNLENKYRAAQRFALKKKPNDTYNYVTLAENTYAVANINAVELVGAKKVYQANSTEKGTWADMYAYAGDANALMVVKEIGDPEYHLVNGDLSAWGDTISLHRADHESQKLYEKGDVKSIVDNDTLSFLNIDNVYEFTKMAPAIFVDTAYVKRGEGDDANTCYQYLLAVEPSFGYHSDDCNIPGHPQGAGVLDTVYGRFLVNLIDTANIYGATHLHSNPYINKNEAGESRAKLSFVEGRHVLSEQKLYIVGKDGKETAFNLNSPAFNAVKFAFRYVDHEAETFKIQTMFKEYYPAQAVADDSKVKAHNEGYLKWINGTVVVEENYANGDVFGIQEGFEGNPTANESIDAASTISVVATNGAVIVKGAEGKNVVISNVLGQQVANTVVTSSEATISAPAGVVVVAVEGEAAVKAIVK
ncbi:DUF6383 domain-containing protein [Parabacteroides sp.]|uniref:DUF6383 domain-containing protein n=1 Tax=Parabacteroides sp. TaxID=1869337 RepID=UPI0030804641